MRRVFTLISTMLLSLVLFARPVYATSNLPIESVDTIITTDEIKVKQLIEDFFEVKQQNFVSSSEIALDSFYAPEILSILSTKTSTKLFEFEKIVRQEISLDILWEKFNVSINDIVIDQNDATVTAYEHYEYLLSYAQGVVSSRGVTYTISCKKVDSAWKITNISTDNMLEDFVDTVDNVSTLFSKRARSITPLSDPKIEAAHQEAEILRTGNVVSAQSVNGYTAVAYEPMKAINYAKTYTNVYDDGATLTTYYNTNFVHHSSDCQNYVSQCVWKGLGGIEGSASKARPMIADGDREWWATSTGTSPVWENVNNFAAYIASGGSGKLGPYGAVGTKGYTANGYAGDIIHLYNEAKGGWYHSMFITTATGSSGSRTAQNYFVCAHTSNRKNESLASILGSNYNDYRIIAITGSYS